MTKVRVKIGFECTDNWNRAEFRALMYKLKDTPYFFNESLDAEIYLISNNDSSTYIYSVGRQLGLNPTTEVFVTHFPSDKVEKIGELGIEIYFTNTQPDFLMIDETLTTIPILVNSIPNRYTDTFDYQNKFLFNLNEIINEKINQV